MTTNPPRERTAHERRVHAANTQSPLPRDGRVDALAGTPADGIPMTGEEDPMVGLEGSGDTAPRDEDAEAEAHPS